MRPVLAKICEYVWLLDGTIDLFDIARLNDALDVSAENDRRAREYDKENNR